MDKWFWSLLSSGPINSSTLSGRHSKSSVMVNIIPCTTNTVMDTTCVCSSWLQSINESTLGVTVGQQFYTLQLPINCRKSWWPTNQMNHPRAWVPPLLFALGICCPWVVSLHLTVSPLVTWFGATEQAGSVSHGHFHLTSVGWGSRAVLEHAGRTLTQGQGKCVSPWAGIWGSDSGMAAWNNFQSKTMSKLGPNDIGDQTTSRLKLTLELCTLFLWDPHFVGTWAWICSFHSFHAVWLFDVSRASLSVNGLCFHAVFL